MPRSQDKTTRELNSIRDTVESIWVAIVLAFVLRAFMIEAFVIPTGSMAPRLMGEHWQLVCPSCGYDYAYGVPRSVQGDPSFDRSVQNTPTGAICPNCRYPYPYARRPEFSRNGDRVLVMKYLYRFAEPHPWDVVVFRNPQNNRENYIKRLAGLPGEMIEIVHGDVFFRKGTDRNADGTIDEEDFRGAEALRESPWEIRRKSERAQEAVWQVVFDNDYRPDPELLGEASVISPRWEAPEGGWELSGLDGRRFAFLGEGDAEIRFQADRATFLPRYGYNRPPVRGERPRRYDERTDVVGDLKLSFVLIPHSRDSQIALSIDSLEHRFVGELHADGTALLLHDPPDDIEGNWVEWGRTKIDPIRVGRSCLVALSHVDFRVSLWVAGEVVLSSSDEQYRPDREAIRDRVGAAVAHNPVPIPTPQVKILARGGQCELTHVKLHRDVYYTSPPLSRIPRGDMAPLGEYARKLQTSDSEPSRGWGTSDNPITLRRFDDPELDEFFMLGDNSPQSLDGRAWTSAAPTLRLTSPDGGPLYRLGTVPRYNLIGKAFFVYWPAGFHVPALPHLPIIPNVGRMRFIR